MRSGPGTSPDPCQIIYHGPGPFSEPETAAMKTFLEGIQSNLKAFMTVHAYGQMWFYPYAHAKGVESSNKEEVVSFQFRAF